MTLPNPVFAPFGEHKVAYYSYGTGTEALVFIHGWTCDSSLWEPQQPLFSRYSRTVLVDYLGHGNSDSPDIDYAIETLARSVRAALEHAKIEKAVIIGHSMGGSVSTMLLRLFPQMVNGIIYVDSFFHPPNHYLNNVELEALREQYGSEDAFDAIIRPMFSVSPLAMQEKIFIRMKSTPKHVRLSCVCTPSRPHAWRHDEVYDIPTMNVGTLFAPVYDRAWKRHLPRFEMRQEEWKDCSHFPFVDQPERFNEMVERWIFENELQRC